MSEKSGTLGAVVFLDRHSVLVSQIDYSVPAHCVMDLGSGFYVPRLNISFLVRRPYVLITVCPLFVEFPNCSVVEFPRIFSQSEYGRRGRRI